MGYNGSGYFGLLLTDDGYQKVDLVIGEHFTTEENGYTYHYYEILAGVKEGDILVAEDILPSSEMVVGK